MGALAILGGSCRRACVSLRMYVISYNASSRLHCCVSKSDKADQSFLSAERSSVVVTVRSPRFESGCVRQRSAIFLSKALRFDRCAAWHSASALRNTV